MAKTLDQVIESLPLAEQREIEAQAKALIEEETKLRDMHKAVSIGVGYPKLRPKPNGRRPRR